MARQLQNLDHDLLIGMDHANLWNMHCICGGDFSGKMDLLLEYAGRPEQEVAGPWYTRDFDTAWSTILDGCKGLLEILLKQEIKAA